MNGVTPSAHIIPRCECGSPVELESSERLDDGSELRIYKCSDCKRIIPRKSEAAETSRASEDSPARPATGGRKSRARPRRNKLSYKNRWLLSQHLVIALRRAGVVCNIVVQDHAGNVVSLPTEDPSPPQELGLALRCSGIEVEQDLLEGDPGGDGGPSPSKHRH
jgi:hypothetical protein